MKQKQIALLCIENANKAVSGSGVLFSLKEEFFKFKETVNDEEVDTPAFKVILVKKELGYSEEEIQEISIRYDSKDERKKESYRDSAYGAMLVHVISMGLMFCKELYEQANKEETFLKKDEEVKDTVTDKQG